MINGKKIYNDIISYFSIVYIQINLIYSLFVSIIHKILICKQYNIPKNNKNIIHKKKTKIDNNFKIHITKEIFKNLIFINMIFTNLSFSKSIFISGDSSITLKINKTGERYIFYHGQCDPSPTGFDEIYINGKKEEIKYKYNFIKSDNNITLIWKKVISSTCCMFKECPDITEINLTKFDSSQTTNMCSMFHDCSSLTSIDLTNFVTSRANYLSHMFRGCIQLNSLDLSSFYLNQALYIDTTFYNCTSLLYINLENVLIKSDIGHLDTFENTASNLIIYSNYEEWYSILGGSNIYIICNKNFNENTQYKCHKKGLNIEYNKYICKRCGEFYYQIYNDSFNNNSYINCYKSFDGYYLDKDDNYPIFKQCYLTCKTCDKGGDQINHNCIKCKDNYKYELSNESNYLNCYNKCQYYHYTNDFTNKSYCTKGYNCPENYNKLIIDKSECIDDCSKDSIYIYEYNNICYKEMPYTTDIIKEELKTYYSINNISSYDDIYGNFYQKQEFEGLKEIIFNKYNMEYILFENEYEIKFEYKLIKFLLSTLEKKNNDSIINKSNINFGKCETVLKNNNNINYNNSLYILIIEVLEDGMKVPKIEYELYYKLNNNNLKKLNLSDVKNYKINISNPINIEEDLDKYNSSSDYYNNICLKITKDNKVDISLYDRRKNYIDNNLTLCEENCKLIEYNNVTKKVKCSCFIKLHLPFIKDVKFDKNKLYESFTDLKNFLNIKFMKCYKYINIKSNYGLFIQIFIMILFFIILFIFWFKYYSILLNKIWELIDKKRKILQSKKMKKIKKNPPINRKNNTNDNKLKSNPKKKNTLHHQNKRNLEKKKSNFNQERKFQINNRTFLSNTINDNNNLSSRKIIKNFEILKYNDKELNSLSYEKALIHDKRTYIQYYLSLFRTNHIFIFSFYSNNRDYNSQVIKILLFFFFFDVDLFVNILFFNDDTLHSILLDEGEYNFIYQIPQILYSTLISVFINKFINFFALSEKNVLKIKKEKKYNDFNLKVEKLKIILKIKFILFFVFTFLFLSIFSFYIICFCGIYENTQIHLIKDTVISLGISLIYPVGIYLIPGIFRISALHSKTKNKVYLYNISKLIQIL